MKNIHLRQFTTERLVIRPMDIEDAQFLLELLNSEKWIRFIGDRGLNTVKDAEEYIVKKMNPELRKNGICNNVLILRETGEKVGTCGLYNREGINGIDIGYAMLPRFEGKGYAIEAARRMVEFAFQDLKEKKLSAIIAEENKDSISLITKLDFKYSGKTKLPNDPDELNLYILYAI